MSALNANTIADSARQQFLLPDRSHSESFNPLVTGSG